MPPLPALTLQPLTADHWPHMLALLDQHAATEPETFALEEPTWREWNWTFLPHSRLAAVADTPTNSGALLGWAALAAISRRAVYAGVAEASLLVSALARGQGVGRQLLTALIAESEKNGIWTLQATLFPEHTTSLSIYAAAGFREVGLRERIGQHGGIWRDALLLERRSTTVGLRISRFAPGE